MATTFKKAQWFGIAVTTVAGLLTIAFYLFIVPQTLSILNTDVVTFTVPSETIYNVGDEIKVAVVFRPGIVEGEATGYYLIASSPDKVFLQEEATGLSYTTPFTLTRSFVADTTAEEVTIRAEVTIDSKVYYNEITTSVIDPTVEEVTTTEEITTEEAPGFEISLIFGCLVLFVILTKQRKDEIR